MTDLEKQFRVMAIGTAGALDGLMKYNELQDRHIAKLTTRVTVLTIGLIGALIALVVITL